MSDEDTAAIAAADVEAKTHGGEDCETLAVLDDFGGDLDESFALAAMNAVLFGGEGCVRAFVAVAVGGFGSVEAVDAERAEDAGALGNSCQYGCIDVMW